MSLVIYCVTCYFLQELLESGYLTEVHKFSKFIHGSCTLFPEMVQVRLKGVITQLLCCQITGSGYEQGCRVNDVLLRTHVCCSIFCVCARGGSWMGHVCGQKDLTAAPRVHKEAQMYASIVLPAASDPLNNAKVSSGIVLPEHLHTIPLR
jgi:hypothetical protein